MWKAGQLRQSQVKLADCNFPGDFQSKIGTPLWQALDNPIRREVIRLLCDEPRTQSDISSRLGISLSEIGYHVSVLEEAGAASHEDPERSRPASQRILRSALGDNQEVRLVLVATQQPDRRFREEVRSSSRVLKMFQVPGPFTTIRLGSRQRPRTEEP